MVVKNITKTLKRFIYKPEYWYLFIALGTAVLGMIFNDPISHDDEPYHFNHAFHMFANNDETPVDARLIQIDADNQSKLSADMDLEHAGLAVNFYKPVVMWREAGQPWGSEAWRTEDTASVTDIGHLPQGVGMLIARAIDHTPSYNWLYYWGCTFGLLATVTITFFAIRSVRKFGFLFFLIATLPTILWNNYGLGYDSINAAMALLFCALIFNLFLDRHKLHWKRFVPMALVGGCLLFTKLTNVLLLFLLLGLPNYRAHYKYIKSKINTPIKKIITVAAGVAVLAALLIIAYQISGDYAAKFGTGRLGLVDITLRSVFQTIFKTDVGVYLASSTGSWTPTIDWITNGVFGVASDSIGANSVTPLWLSYLYVIMIVLLVIRFNTVITARKLRSLMITWLTVFVTISICVWLGMMMMFSDYTAYKHYIFGVQGRYFSPYLILLVPTVMYFSQKIKISWDKNTTVLVSAILVLFVNIYPFAVQVISRLAMGLI